MPFGNSAAYTDCWFCCTRSYARRNASWSGGVRTSRPGGIGRPRVNVSNTVSVDVSATRLSTSFFTSALNGPPFSSIDAMVC